MTNTTQNAKEIILRDLETILEENGDFSELGGIAKQAAERAHAQGREKLLNAVVVVLGQADQGLRNQVANLRRLRKQEKQQAARVKQIDAAVQHLKKTANPLPYYKAIGMPHLVHQFCADLGVDVPDSDDKLWSAD